MKCPTRMCSGAVHRVAKWEQGDHCEYVPAVCNHCHMLYWLIKRDGKYYLKDRLVSEGFYDHRKDAR